jgi:hypothetical protein
MNGPNYKSVRPEYENYALGKYPHRVSILPDEYAGRMTSPRDHLAQTWRGAKHRISTVAQRPTPRRGSKSAHRWPVRCGAASHICPAFSLPKIAAFDFSFIFRHSGIIKLRSVIFL